MTFSHITQVREALRKALLFYNHETTPKPGDAHPISQAANETGRFKRQWISYRERAIDAMGNHNTE